MAIEIINTKGLSQDPLVIEIINKVQAYPNIFKYLARIFSDYKINKESLRSEIFSYIDRVLNSPRLSLHTDVNTVDRMKVTVKKIYELDPERFAKVRGEILENTVYYFGPVTTSFLRDMVYIEPILKDSNIIIGESDNKCDFVFYQGEADPIEFIECKANIVNVVPKTLPFKKAKEAHRNKVIYLDKAYKYLRENYSEPRIYFACYNLNYTRELNNLQNNWGYVNMDIINAEEIINGKKGES